MSVAIDKIIALFIMCFGVYGLWTAFTGLRADKAKFFGKPILKSVRPKRFFIEIIGRFDGTLVCRDGTIFCNLGGL